jgi:hypothetical protein
VRVAVAAQAADDVQDRCLEGPLAQDIKPRVASDTEVDVVVPFQRPGLRVAPLLSMAPVTVITRTLAARTAPLLPSRPVVSPFRG